MSETVESIFRDVASMVAVPKPDENPFQSEEYAKFVASMIPLCQCAERFRPCDGILAGGMCDGMKDDRPEYEENEDFEPDDL